MFAMAVTAVTDMFTGRAVNFLTESCSGVISIDKNPVDPVWLDGLSPT